MWVCVSSVPPVGVSGVPIPSINLSSNSSSVYSSSSSSSSSSRRREEHLFHLPPRLMRSLSVSLRRCLSLVLNSIWGYGDWAQLSVCCHLPFFSR